MRNRSCHWLIPLALTWLIPSECQGDDIAIVVKADRVLHPVSRLLTGACIEDVNHEIYGGLYSQMIFGESFQEPPFAPAVNGFKSYGGRWKVADGAVRIEATDGPKLVSDHAPFKDGEVSVELFFAERKGHNAGLIVRLDRPEVGADRWFGYEVSLEPVRQSLHLARHRNNYEPLKDVPCDVPINRWIALEVRLKGTEIEIVVDGKSSLRYDDTEKALLAGAVGLRAWQSQASFRNLRVKTGGDVESLSFRQPDSFHDLSGMWRAVQGGNAEGRFDLLKENAFAGSQSQQVHFDSGRGRWGIENQGLNRWGMSFVKGKPYEGYVWAMAEKPTTVLASLESRDGSRIYAEAPLEIAAGAWQRLDFHLTPSDSDRAGRFVLALKHPGTIVLGHAFLQPGEWGRFQGLPVRRDVAEGLIDQGITVLRYGGSMVNNSGYRWKTMIGPRDRRPPYAGLWYPYSSNGWGILDFMDFCEAAGFEYVPAFNMDETPQDMADFLEYTRGTADSTWGRRRIADGHAQPYRLRYLELGNEERVDDAYAAKFAALAQAIWARDRDLILVVGDFAYDAPISDPSHVRAAASRISSLAGHQKILKLARENQREVWFDVHVWTEGPGPSPSLKALPSFIDALAKLADGAKHKVVVFEYNAGNHAIRRALGNALATNAIMRDGRIPIVTSANGLQPDRQNDNGWDQGLLFLTPSQVWLQPPGYVTRMLSRNDLRQVVACEVTDPQGKLDVVARLGDDGKALTLQVVNIGDQAVTASIQIDGFAQEKTVAHVTTLAGPLGALNTAETPDAVIPRQGEWSHAVKEGRANYQFPPHSFTILRYE